MWLSATLVVGLLFAWQSHKGFNLWDEGFMWYGAQRTLHGEVPIRDFMAYDPARYYWAAAVMKLAGNEGPLALRAGSAVLQVVAIYLALAAIARGAVRSSAGFIALAAVTLAMWMLPYFKMSDLLACLLLIAVYACLIEAPSPGRYLLAGIGLGLAAFIGRNHGMYGLAAGGVMLVWLKLQPRSSLPLFKAALLFGMGTAIGFLPIVLMACLLPGFAVAFWDSIRFLFELKATNLELPVPWPWRVSFSAPWDIVLRDMLLGCFFVGALAFGALSLLSVLFRGLRGHPVPPAFAAAAFLGLPYAHYAFSRADHYHLAFGIFPLLVGLLAWMAASRSSVKWASACALLVLSVLTTITYHPGWQCRSAEQCTEISISGSKILADRTTADDVILIRQLVAQYAPDGQSFLVAPLWPGAYALFDRRSPMWESYGLFKRSEAFEKAEIARIQAARPAFVFIYDHPLDGHEALRFKNTHPLIYDYVATHFDPVPHPARPDYRIYVARGNPGLHEAPRFLQRGAEELARLDRGAASLRIVNWGPREAVAGSVPNPQPGGSAGIWIQVAGDNELGEVRVVVDGEPALSSAVAPGTITAAVDARAFHRPGEKTVTIEQTATGRQIAVGRLHVRAGSTPP